MQLMLPLLPQMNSSSRTPLKTRRHCGKIESCLSTATLALSKIRSTDDTFLYTINSQSIIFDWSLKSKKNRNC